MLGIGGTGPPSCQLGACWPVKRVLYLRLTKSLVLAPLAVVTALGLRRGSGTSVLLEAWLCVSQRLSMLASRG